MTFCTSMSCGIRRRSHPAASFGEQERLAGVSVGCGCGVRAGRPCASRRRGGAAPSPVQHLLGFFALCGRRTTHNSRVTFLLSPTFMWFHAPMRNNIRFLRHARACYCRCTQRRRCGHLRCGRASEHSQHSVGRTSNSVCSFGLEEITDEASPIASLLALRSWRPATRMCFSAPRRCRRVPLQPQRHAAACPPPHLRPFATGNKAAHCLAMCGDRSACDRRITTDSGSEEDAVISKVTGIRAWFSSG